MATKTLSNPFPVELLKATEFYTAENKSRFGINLLRFVSSGFKAHRFTKSLYTQLSMCFGHIAHYNRGGFYTTWFSSSAKQRSWVEYISEYVPCGDPEYTFSDLERMFKAWLTMNRETIDLLIRQNEAVEGSAAACEQKRRDALLHRTHQGFKVAAMSQNVGSFGHHQFVMVARDGCVYKVCHVQSNGPWHVGQVFDVRLGRNCLPTWDNMCVEVPERMLDAPPKVVDKVWNG